MTRATPWVEAVARAVRAIPKGRTASYSQVALLAGKPGAARAVVRALHATTGIPWWRVTRQDGTLAPPVRSEQARRLKREGVRVVRGRVSAPGATARPRSPAAPRSARPAGADRRARSGPSPRRAR